MRILAILITGLFLSLFALGQNEEIMTVQELSTPLELEGDFAFIYKQEQRTFRVSKENGTYVELDVSGNILSQGSFSRAGDGDIYKITPSVTDTHAALGTEMIGKITGFEQGVVTVSLMIDENTVQTVQLTRQ
jgi:hypothetical protein